LSGAVPTAALSLPAARSRFLRSIQGFNFSAALVSRA
jgi:hypothetical protein